MTKEQVFEVLSLLNAAYPNFDITQEKIDIWHRLMKNQAFDDVMENVEKYVLENKFPPSISEIRGYERKNIPNMLGKLKANAKHLENMKARQLQRGYGEDPELELSLKNIYEAIERVSAKGLV